MPHSTTVDYGQQPLTAEELRRIIQFSIAEHSAIAGVKPIDTVWSDRIALGVEDRDGQLWRVHVLTELIR